MSQTDGSVGIALLDTLFDSMLETFRRTVARPVAFVEDVYESGLEATDIERILLADPNNISANDLIDYLYSDVAVLPDNFSYLLPAVLRIWAIELLSSQGTFRPVATPWVARRAHSLLALLSIFTLLPEEATTVAFEFMDEVLLECIGRMQNFPISRAEDIPFWYANVVSYSTLSPGFRRVWMRWWEMSTPNHTVAAAIVCGLLLMDDVSSVVRPPVGDASVLSGIERILFVPNTDGSEVPCLPENVAFLRGQMNAESIERRIRVLLDSCCAHELKACQAAAGRMMGTMQATPCLVRERCDLFCRGFAIPSRKGYTWGELAAGKSN